jgi:hypothetical protein
MKVDKFLSTLLPSFERSKVKEDIGLLREELKDVVLPVYDSAVKVMKNRKFLAQPIVEFDKHFKDNVKTPFRGNFIVVTHQALDNAYKNLDMLEEMVEKYYTDEIFRDALTYLKINILQYVQAISFAARFSRTLLLWTYAAEVNAVENNAEEMGHELTPGERQWISENAATYFRCITIISAPKRDVEKKFADIPDVIATEENQQFLPKTVGVARMDPFMFGLIPVVLNPIYHVRMAVAEWQVSRHRAAMEEKRMLEFRLLQLKQAEEGKKDAKLQQQIEYTEGRLQKINYKLKKMEEKYA